MSFDSRGVEIQREDIVVWFGRLGRTRPMLHLGVVEGMGFWGKIRVGMILHGETGEWRTNGVTTSIRPRDVLVIEDAPESPYE